MQTPFFHVGISGWAYSQFREVFYPPKLPAKDRFSYYTSIFDCVEINSTFYRVPMESTVRKWAAAAPDDFHFTFKMWRDVTHGPGFIVTPEFIRNFMAVIDNAGDKRGPLLIQLPPRLTAANIKGLELILQTVTACDPQRRWKPAVEFRNPLWYVDEVYAMLNHYRASLVLQDMPGSIVWAPNAQADFIYLRFHGVKGDYRGTYSDEFLFDKARLIKSWRAQGKDVYAFFNNTIDAFAPANALRLREFVESNSPSE